MKITFSPMRRDDHLTLGRQADILTINGEVFDFSPLPDGAILPREAIASPWFAGPVERKGGVLSLSLVLSHGAGALQSVLFPDLLVLDADGLVATPVQEALQQELEVTYG